jgi:hypothetical protein
VSSANVITIDDSESQSLTSPEHDYRHEERTPDRSNPLSEASCLKPRAGTPIQSTNGPDLPLASKLEATLDSIGSTNDKVFVVETVWIDSYMFDSMLTKTGALHMPRITFGDENDRLYLFATNESAFSLDDDDRPFHPYHARFVLGASNIARMWCVQYRVPPQVVVTLSRSNLGVCC